MGHSGLTSHFNEGPSNPNSERVKNGSDPELMQLVRSDLLQIDFDRSKSAR